MQIHFGPKHNPFWAKTQSVLGQNGFYFAAKRRPFCGKTGSILRQNAGYFAAKCKCVPLQTAPETAVVTARDTHAGTPKASPSDN